MIFQKSENFLKNNLIIFGKNLMFLMKKGQKNNHLSWFLNIIFFDFLLFLYAISAFSFLFFLSFSLSMAQFPHKDLVNKPLFE
jgi:hypothetical protein